MELDPNFPLAYEYSSWTLIQRGRYEEAIQAHEKGQLLSGISPEAAAAEAAAMQTAFKHGGEKGYWYYNLETTLHARARRDGSIPASQVAIAYALVGDKDNAFE